MVSCRCLENTEDDRADKGEGEVGGHDAELTDEGTKGHWGAPVIVAKRHNAKASDPFQSKKGSFAVHPFHPGGALRFVTWLKSRENKALMSP
jgi:hypothetical protein